MMCLGVTHDAIASKASCDPKTETMRFELSPVKLV